MVLLHGDDEGGVAIGVADIRIGSTAGQKIPHLVISPVKSSHEQRGAGSFCLRLWEYSYKVCSPVVVAPPGPPALVLATPPPGPWAPPGIIVSSQAREQGRGAVAIVFSSVETTTMA